MYLREQEDNFFWFFLFMGMLKNKQKPVESYSVLGLSTDATAEDVKRKYRELSNTCHPDKGGNSDNFIKITEAKNKILSILQ